MPSVELTSGLINYGDTGGDGPILVLGHGLLMDGRQWRKVLPLLPEYRCITPTLPLGAHTTPMNEDADLTETGVAGILGEFLDACAGCHSVDVLAVGRGDSHRGASPGNAGTAAGAVGDQLEQPVTCRS